ATHFALKRSFRVGGNQIPKTLGERRLHEEFNEHASPPCQHRTLAPRLCWADAIRHVGAVNRRLTPRDRTLGRRRRSATERPRLIEARALTEVPSPGDALECLSSRTKGRRANYSPKDAFDGQGDCSARFGLVADNATERSTASGLDPKQAFPLGASKGRNALNSDHSPMVR